MKSMRTDKTKNTAVNCESCQPQAERIRRLEAQCTQLISMFELSPGFMAILQGPSLVYELANEGYYRLVGQRDLIGWPFREALPELEGQGTFELLSQVYSSGKPFVGQEMRVCLRQAPDGPMSEVYVDLLLHPLRNADGFISGIFIQGQNVTEQKRAKEALKASNERFNFALKGARDGVWDWNVRSNEVAYSRRWKEILGYAEDDLADEYGEWSRRIHPDDRAATLQKLGEALRQDSPLDIECRLRCKDGSYKWVLSRGVIVMRDEAGQPARLTGTMTDISEKRHPRNWSGAMPASTA